MDAAIFTVLFDMPKYQALKDGVVVGEGETFDQALQEAIRHGIKKEEVTLRTTERSKHVHV